MRRFQPVRCQASMRSVWTSRTCSAGRSSLRSHHERRHRSATLREQLRESRRRVAPARSVDPAEDQDAEVAEPDCPRGTDLADRIHHAGRGRVAAREERGGERRRCRSGGDPRGTGAGESRDRRPRRAQSGRESVSGAAATLQPVWIIQLRTGCHRDLHGARTSAQASNNWQTITLQRGPDSLNPINPTVLWNNGNAATADLEGDYGALDGIAFVCNGDPGYYDIYIDDIANGTNGVLENFEGDTQGTTFGFSQPSFSGTTSGFLQGAPNSSVISG